ncbi:Hypothetical_protein [Hexamita inflata]|uniref:Hypothetical_protein n=1 Tax=Hexamita inflata TaxID=28002 RepID=A0AA86UM36_9EUKA|nr:Hypothetical protein HINF_LOCUS44326 [Hexamita inflata]
MASYQYCDVSCVFCPQIQDIQSAMMQDRFQQYSCASKYQQAKPTSASKISIGRNQSFGGYAQGNFSQQIMWSTLIRQLLSEPALRGHDNYITTWCDLKQQKSITFLKHMRY